MIIPEPDELAVRTLERRLEASNGRASVEGGMITRADCDYFGELMRLVVDRWPTEVPIEALNVEMYGMTVPRMALRSAVGIASARFWTDVVIIKGGAMQIARRTLAPHEIPIDGIKVHADISNMRFKPTRILAEIHDELRFWISALEAQRWEPVVYKIVGRVNQAELDGDGKPRLGGKKKPTVIRLPVGFNHPKIHHDLPRSLALTEMLRPGIEARR